MVVRSVGPKVLLAVLAALVLALGAVALWILSGDQDEARAGGGGEDRRADAARPGDPAARSMGTGEPAARDERRSKRAARRRFRDAEQRRELIAAIELARTVRRERRLSGQDGAGASDDGAAGELSKESIRDAVQAVIEDVKACYDEQLERSPALGGKIILDFTIDAEEGVGGVVDRVEVSDASDEPMRQATQLSECIVDTIYTLELPAPEGGGTVDVSYPMVMSPGDPDDRQR